MTLVDELIKKIEQKGFYWTVGRTITSGNMYECRVWKYNTVFKLPDKTNKYRIVVTMCGYSIEEALELCINKLEIGDD